METIIMPYKEYKEIADLMPKDYYDPETKSVVISLGECKRYTVKSSRDEIFTFYKANKYDSRHPRLDPYDLTFVVDNESEGIVNFIHVLQKIMQGNTRDGINS